MMMSPERPRFIFRNFFPEVAENQSLWFRNKNHKREFTEHSGGNIEENMVFEENMIFRENLDFGFLDDFPILREFSISDRRTLNQTEITEQLNKRRQCHGSSEL